MDLPAPLLRVLPELESELFPSEPLSTCSSCAMAVPGQRVVFTAAARCCTYHPRLPNFLAGLALRRGGVGAQRLAARIEQREGVSAMGITPPDAWLRRWSNRTAEAFGRDEQLTCPYWVPGPLGCSIHEDRDTVCRTWHCRLTNGARSQAAWGALNVVLFSLEEQLARFCLDSRRVPLPADDASPDVFLSFYLACAQRLDHLDDAEVIALRTPRLLGQLSSVSAHCVDRDRPLPDIVEARIREVLRSPGREGGEEQIALVSWAPFDPVDVPPWIFELLSRFDGVRTWRDALDETRTAGFPATESLVRQLWERGLLGTLTESPNDTSVEPQ